MNHFRKSVSIPVFSNGNVRNLVEADESLRITQADGVMSACGLLNNPALFSGQQISKHDLAKEYLVFCRQYPTDITIIRGHLFRILIDMWVL